MPRRPRTLLFGPIAGLAMLMACAMGVAGGWGLTSAHATIGTFWPRPRVHTAITIRLHIKADYLHLRDSRNYILKMPRHKKTGPLYIRGGGNVRIIGGYMSTRVEGPNINISDDRGTQDGRIVHIEGLLINGSSGVPSDGIKIQAPHTIVQIERVRIVGLHGKLSGYHADVVQPGGGVKVLRIDGLTGSSHYNNFYLRRENNPLEPPIGKVVIRNANMFGYHNGSIPHTTLRGISIGTQPLDPSNDDAGINCDVTNPMWLHNFWVHPPRGVRPAQFVYPHDRMGGTASKCRSAWHAGNHTVNWPDLAAGRGGPVHGSVHVGPRRDFIPPHRVGIHYHWRR